MFQISQTLISWPDSKLGIRIALRIATAVLVASGIGHADTVRLGLFSFNTLVPSVPGSPGVNDFAIDDFTGNSSLPPDFPAADSLTFLKSAVKLTAQDGTQQTITLGDLAPGSYTPLSLQFSASQHFAAALFTATLSSTQFALSDGSSFRVTSDQISVDLIPSSGPLLSPDVDFAPVVVSNAPSITPEPGYAGLILLALALGGWIKRRSGSARRYIV